MLRKNTKPYRVLVDQSTEFGGEFKKSIKKSICKAIKIYSSRSETKAAVAEKAIRSLKNFIYRCMEENSENVHKMESFVNTLNTRVNRSIGNHTKKEFLINFFLQKPYC